MSISRSIRERDAAALNVAMVVAGCPRHRITAMSALLLAIAASCSDAPTEPDVGLRDGPAFAISDAVHQGGVPQFYWLPPTVPNPGPSVTGTFDGDLLGAAGVYPQLEVRICPPGVSMLCPASGAGSFKTFNGYGSTPITIQQAGNYQLLWNKNELTSGNTYRAWVLVMPAPDANPLALGFADVKVVANTQALKQVDPTEFVGLVAGNPLYLKFTVRTGIAGGVNVALASSTLAPGGSTTATATVTDLHGVPVAGATVTWAVTPSGSPPGTISPDAAPSTTDANGQATALLTAGTTAGSGAVTATVGVAPGQLTGSASFSVAAADEIAGDGLVAANAFTCGLTSAGVPHCWGLNDHGQLGNNSTTNSSMPVGVILPAGVAGFAHITGGGDWLNGGGYACGLTSEGVAYCWGSNDHGQLGNGTPGDSHSPVMVSLPGGVTGFTYLAGGSTHACGLTSNGAAYCWGDDSQGQLGNGPAGPSDTPVPVNLPAGVSGFVKLTAGGAHTCGLTAAGAAYCWGDDGQGQLGNGAAGSSDMPVAVSLPAGVSGFTHLTAGGYHTCALTAANAAFCWGDDSTFQLGNGPVGSSDTPVAVSLPAGESGFTQLAAGSFHTCGQTSTGTLYCWGIVVDGTELVPVSLPAGVSGFERLTAGTDHTCGLTSTGAAYCWGFNSTGQLGNGSTSDSATPVLVSGGLIFQTP